MTKTRWWRKAKAGHILPATILVNHIWSGLLPSGMFPKQALTEREESTSWLTPSVKHRPMALPPAQEPWGSQMGSLLGPLLALESKAKCTKRLESGRKARRWSPGLGDTRKNHDTRPAARPARPAWPGDPGLSAFAFPGSKGVEGRSRKSACRQNDPKRGTIKKARPFYAST